MSTHVEEPIIFVVDDDDAVRSAIGLLIESYGWSVCTCASAEEFLCTYRGQRGCLILDLKMPSMTGLELQQDLAERGITIPVIIVTAYHEHPMARRAKEAGALAVLAKPCRERELLQHIARSLSASTELVERVG